MSGSGGVQQSPGERAQADLAEKQWQDYQDRFVPLENDYQKQLDRIRGDRPLATGRANTDVNQAYDAAQKNMRTSQFSNRVNPNSGRATMGLADLTTDRATGASGAMTNADQATEDRYYAGQNQLVALGQGQATNANVGFRDYAALSSSNEINKAQAHQLTDAARWNAAGTVAGVGLRYGLNQLNDPSGAGLAGSSKPWWDVTSRPRQFS